MVMARAFPRGQALGTALAALLVGAPVSAEADDDQDALELAGEVAVDLAAVAAGDGDRKLRALTNVSLFADADLGAMIGWRGAKAHFQVLDNRGARPNDAAGTLQGVNNIEVPRAGLRLFEAWVEQDLGKGASLLAGLYDLNSEFYANDAAGLLIAPPFGIGSELAATGPNGPSIFPSSALAVRVNLPLAGDAGYLRMAVVNARANTIGDSGGVDFSFRDGVLAIGEAGWDGAGWHVAAGGWRYLRNPEDIFETDLTGRALRKPSQGAYVVVERALLAEGGTRQVTAFLRAGISDPHTTPYAGGFQTGVLMGPVFVARPDSQLSLGLNHAWTNAHYRTLLQADGNRPAHGERMVELTYADALAEGLTVQPDVQWIHRPGALLGARDVVVATTRLTFSF